MSGPAGRIGAVSVDRGGFGAVGAEGLRIQQVWLLVAAHKQEHSAIVTTLPG